MSELADALRRSDSQGCCWHNLFVSGMTADSTVCYCSLRAIECGRPNCVALISPVSALSVAERRLLRWATWPREEK